jgi:3-deoxy-7-phosphoheptulonate synthase
MLIRLSATADVREVKSSLQALGIWCSFRISDDGDRVVVVDDSSPPVSKREILQVPGVVDIFPVKSPHPLVDAMRNRVLDFPHLDVSIGGGSPPLLLSGPCSIDSEVDIHQAAAMVAAANGRFIRGGAYKPRTSPYSFCGHGEMALSWIADAAKAHSLGVITEALGAENVEKVAAVADIIQVGARNMQNYPLLRTIGETRKPVLLKRSMSATIKEWLLAGEHLLHAGASHVIFCERGIRGFDSNTRNLLDLAAAALLKHVHGLTVVVDPSHAVGRRDLIIPLSRASLALGIDGLLIEAHHNSGYAKSDGPQALSPDELKQVGRLVRQDFRFDDIGTEVGS